MANEVILQNTEEGWGLQDYLKKRAEGDVNYREPLQADLKAELLKREAEDKRDLTKVDDKTRWEILERDFGGPINRESGIEGWWPRFDIARSSKLPDKIKKIQEAYPQAEIQLREDPGRKDSYVAGIKLPDEDSWRLIDAPDLEVVEDLADAAGTFANEDTALGLLAAWFTRGRGVMGRMLAQGAAGATGHITKSEIERARGYESGTRAEVYGLETPINALLGVAGEGATSSLAIPLRGITGRGAIKLTPEEQAIQKFAVEEGLPMLRSYHVVPQHRAFFLQAMRTGNRAFRKGLEPIYGAYHKLKPPGEIDYRTLTPKNLQNILDTYENAVTELAKRDLTGFTHLSRLELGAVMDLANRSYRNVSSKRIGQIYDDAFQAARGETWIDIATSQQEAKNILKGIHSVEHPGGVAFTFTGEMIELPQKTRQVSVELSKKFKSALDDLAKIESRVSNLNEKSSLEQIKALRTRFYDLKQPDAHGMLNEENYLAGRIWRQLTEDMKKLQGDAGEEAVGLWREANKQWAKREKTLALEEFVRISQSTDPYRLGKSFLEKPPSPTFLKTMEKEQPGYFGLYRKGFQGYLLENSEQIDSVLTKWKKDFPETYDMMIDPAEDVILRRTSREIKALRTGPFAKTLARREQAGLQIEDLVENVNLQGTPQQLERVVAASGGWDSQLGKDMAWGVLTYLHKKSTALVQGKEAIDPSRFRSYVEKLEQSGYIKVLPEWAQKRVANFKRYMNLMEDFSDVGASMQAATVASQKAELFSPKTIIGEAGQIAKIITGYAAGAKNFIGAAWYSSDIATNILMGRGGKQSSLWVLKGLGVSTFKALGEGATTQRPEWRYHHIKPGEGVPLLGTGEEQVEHPEDQ